MSDGKKNGQRKRRGRDANKWRKADTERRQLHDVKNEREATEKWGWIQIKKERRRKWKEESG